jgi:hypothetical protein
MHVKCPSCLHNLDLPEPADDAPLTCPDCQARFGRDGKLVPLAPAPIPRHQPVSPIRRGYAPLAIDPEEYEEERQERREERQERREEREYRRDDRGDRREDRHESKERNPLAIVGFSISLASLLLAAGGLLFGHALTFYLGFAMVLSLPGALVGLIFSVLGLLYRKVMRPLAVVGLVMSGTLLLLVIPAGFYILKTKL